MLGLSDIGVSDAAVEEFCHALRRVYPSPSFTSATASAVQRRATRNFTFRPTDGGEGGGTHLMPSVDLSHNFIGDSGAIAIASMIKVGGVVGGGVGR